MRTRTLRLFRRQPLRRSRLPGALLIGVFADTSLDGAGLEEGVTVGAQFWIQLISFALLIVSSTRCSRAVQS